MKPATSNQGTPRSYSWENVRKPKCHLCKVKIDKNEGVFHKLYKLTRTGKKIWAVFFCDDICMMDYLLNAYFVDDNAWRIEDSKGNAQTLIQFQKDMREKHD